MAQLTRALGNLEGDVETRLRWHPFRMAPKAATTNPRSFHDYLAKASGRHKRAVRRERPDRGRP
jgi:predicted DsbA family dithiol-disulfide isomerase